MWEAGERGGPRLLGGEEAWGLSYFSAQFWGGLDMKGKIFTVLPRAQKISTIFCK